MNPQEGLAPCERFTIVESRQTQNILRCDVCEHVEDVHKTAGRRVLTGGEIEELRRQRLIAGFEKMQEERKRDEPPVPSANGNKASE